MIRVGDRQLLAAVRLSAKGFNKVYFNSFLPAGVGSTVVLKDCDSMRQASLTEGASLAQMIAWRSSMTPCQIDEQGGRFRPRPGPGPGLPGEGLVPLHRLSNICCSTGACSEVSNWPMGLPQEGWLLLDQDPADAAPVDLVAIGSRRVTVALPVGRRLDRRPPT